eukprot:3769311-Rhodomonas_salina.1
MRNLWLWNSSTCPTMMSCKASRKRHRQLAAPGILKAEEEKKAEEDEEEDEKEEEEEGRRRREKRRKRLAGVRGGGYSDVVVDDVRARALYA